MSWSLTLHSFPLYCSHPDLVDSSLSLFFPDQPHIIPSPSPSPSAVCDLSTLPTLLPPHFVSHYHLKLSAVPPNHFRSTSSVLPFCSIYSVHSRFRSLYPNLARHLHSASAGSRLSMLTQRYPLSPTITDTASRPPSFEIYTHSILFPPGLL